MIAYELCDDFGVPLLRFTDSGDHLPFGPDVLLSARLELPLCDLQRLACPRAPGVFARATYQVAEQQ